MGNLTRSVTLKDAEQLVGLAYDEQSFDCAHLAVFAQERLFGRQVADWLNDTRRQGALARHALVSRYRDDLATRLSGLDSAETGDLALFVDHLVVRAGSHVDVWHLGTVFLEAGECWVLHTHRGNGSSVLQRLVDMAPRGFRLDGFYRWKVPA